MSAKDRLVFRLKGQDGYVDGKEFQDSDLSSVEESTIFLNLECAEISDAGINSLPNLDKLKCIDLDSSKITNASLKKIGSFPNLEEIWIEDTKVTDEGIAHLHKLKQLQFISVTDCEISDKAIKQLKLNLPSVEIH